MARTKPNGQELPAAGNADPGIHAPTPGLLAHAFIDILRRDAGQGVRSQPQSIDLDDGVEGYLDLLSDAPGEDIDMSLAPDLVGATIMLAHAIEDTGGLLRDLRRGAPVLIIEVPGADEVSLVGDALRTCALGGKTKVHSGDGWSGNGRTSSGRELVLFERDGKSSSHNPARGNGSVAAGLRLNMPVVGIAADAKLHLPRDLLRACEHRLTLRPLDAASVAIVVEAVTGEVPATRLAEDLARVVELSDLALTVRRDRGAEGSMERLEAMLRAKFEAYDDGPRLQELEGYGAAKEWGLNLAADLRAYRDGTLGWAEIDKGILLCGPPGVGKTQFALALARTCEVPFLAGSLAQWQASREGHLGHCLSAMRAFFAEARKQAPCIALVDELDSFGDRESFETHRDYSVQVVNAFLECLDGASAREGVVVVGATNNAGRIDPAIRRPGRLDTCVAIPLPDVPALRAILRHHLGPDVLPGVDLGASAIAARGSTGADCEAWVRRAKARARREGRPTEADDLLREIRAGTPEMPATVRWRVAIHEAGHGLVAVGLGIATAVTLGFRADGSGLAEIDIGLAGAPTEADVDDRLGFMLAGRAAERLVFGDVCAGSGGGPASDLAAATRLAVFAEGRLGFGSTYPLVYFDGRGPTISVDDMPWLAKPVSERLARAFTAATNLLAAHRPALMRVAQALDARGYLDDAEVRGLVAEARGGRRRPTSKPAVVPP